EFGKLKKLGRQDYKFMVKQGSQCSIVKLDLSKVLDFIPVMAMSLDEFPYLDAAKEQVGNHPDAWIPVYQELRRIGRAKSQQAKKEVKNESNA
ncbi:MAG TPA: hypothetical protein VK832_02480, partial [Burkholderiaceae bacterium]|nr:hypothetical protein [Burkholderiaceae bacterium]